MVTHERAGRWHRATAQALAMVFGSSCVVCGDLVGPVCDGCAPLPDVQHRRFEGLECYSGSSWADDTATLMLALKEDGVTRVASSLVPLLTAALDSATRGMPRGTATLVPVPTRRAADRRRGYRPVEVLLCAAGLPFRRALRVTGTVHDQRDLGREERARNTQGAFAVRGTAANLGRVILVDDVVTTGATLVNSAQALTSAGIDVVACMTVLSTPKRLITTT